MTAGSARLDHAPRIVVAEDDELLRALVVQILTDDGFESPKVKLAGHDYQRYVANGALKAARAARENQWQVLLN